MIYLNDVPDGGTMFLEQETIIEAVAGRAVIWLPTGLIHTRVKFPKHRRSTSQQDGTNSICLLSLTNHDHN